LYGIADSDIHKLQRLQNRSAKLVLNCRTFDSSKDAWFKLHWLPVKARITFKILTYMYNCSIENAPTYLTELLTEKHVVRSDLRSTAQESFILYDVPFNKNSTFSDRGFMTAAPKLWNGLLSIVKRSMSLDVFKKHLKTYYSSKWYDLF